MSEGEDKNKNIDKIRRGPSFFKIVFFGIKLPFLLIFLLVVGASAATLYGVLQRPDVLGLQVIDESKIITENTLSVLRQMISLPDDEDPVVATVTDSEALREQPFFVNAQNEDVVFMYKKAKKVILYRPKDNKIIDVGTLNVSQQPVAEEEVNKATESVTPPLTAPLTSEGTDSASLATPTPLGIDATESATTEPSI
ncbi:hypothetical protein C4564_04580 [Candidatus Microgenomates bacterium]|nr:MAG: hypothetical protein C4564_04580 [Candidatus Microgenomates bacterium]